MRHFSTARKSGSLKKNPQQHRPKPLLFVVKVLAFINILRPAH